MLAPPRRQLLALLAACWLAACNTPRPRLDTMRTLVDSSPLCADRANTLLVMLPGVYDTPEALVREGFVAAVRERQLPIDMILVDAHVGYYTDESVERRLHADIVAPARARGYRQIWLAGISLGGMGSLAYAEAYDGKGGSQIDGLILLAPYLGNRGLQEEIRLAGGLDAWHATGSHEGGERRIWHWLASRAAQPDTLPMYLGYGSQDRFAPTHRLLATLVPSGNVFALDGGHDWPVWRAGWQAFLDRGDLAARFGRCPAPESRP